MASLSNKRAQLRQQPIALPVAANTFNYASVLFVGIGELPCGRPADADGQALLSGLWYAVLVETTFRVCLRAD